MCSRIRIIPDRRDLRRIGITLAALVGLVSAGWFTMIRMPGRSHEGPLPPLTTDQQALAAELREHVVVLAEDIGPRNVARPAALARAAAYVELALRRAGLQVHRQSFLVDGVDCANVIAEVPGDTRAGEIVVVGAHYDSCGSTPGADDNASGVAGILALARRFSGRTPGRTIRFVGFVNEEPPYFGTDDMGSAQHARACRARGEAITAMLSLEMLGCYSDEPDSQRYPLPGLGLLYPTTGNFITFVGNFSSRRLVRDVVATFREAARFPSEGAALPGFSPGVGLSDHRAFWEEGYPALMVTDTAMNRYAHYHHFADRAARLDYGRMARVVDGLDAVIRRLADAP